MTIGQTAILDAWLSQYTPTDTLDGELDHVFTTEEIISDLSDMADWDTNEVADHIAQSGFRFTPHTLHCPHGWMFRVK
ncbi:hypothetical protein [uncultured Duncaniella sp.]|jgi:uncharacterized protein YidB (DUF937 family)|uniref:hypothetical protein n=1 Tax=uncultured Duncaniella sp. TaxID=2768039 RepID=UPI0025B0CCAF|nr:hypothetical protein [uncultured Duncaniella sp.]